MNPDFPKDERAALESSLTALLLGELPHDQAAALHQKLAQDAELAKLYERLKHTINLVRETVATPAQQVSEPLIPLRLEEKRRQKLLQQFKTAAPKNFAPPRRRAVSWLVPAGIAVALLAVLSGLLLPTLSRSKGGGERLAFGTWSLSENLESAAHKLARSDASSDRERGMLRERLAPRGAVPSEGKPAPPAPRPVPAPTLSLGQAIVLPKTTELAGDAITSSTSEGEQGAFATVGRNRGYYASQGQAGGAMGGGAYGGYGKDASGGAVVAEGRQRRIAASDDFFASRPAKGDPQGGRTVNSLEQAQVLSEGSELRAATVTTSSGSVATKYAATPAPPAAVPMFAATAPKDESAGAGVVRGGSFGLAKAETDGKPVIRGEVAKAPEQMHDIALAAGDRAEARRGRVAGVAPAEVLKIEDQSRQSEVAWADGTKQAPASTATAGDLKLGVTLQPAKGTQKGVPIAGFAMSPQPASPEQSLGRALTPTPPTATGESAGRPAATADFSVAAANTPAPGTAWYFDANGKAVTSTDGDRLPALGDIPQVGRFYRIKPGESAGGAQPKAVDSPALGFADHQEGVTLNYGLAGESSRAVAPTRAPTTTLYAGYAEQSAKAKIGSTAGQVSPKDQADQLALALTRSELQERYAGIALADKLDAVASGIEKVPSSPQITEGLSEGRDAADGSRNVTPVGTPERGGEDWQRPQTRSSLLARSICSRLTSTRRWHL